MTWLSKAFLEMMPKAKLTKEKKDKQNFLKNKNCLCFKRDDQESEKTTDRVRGNMLNIISHYRNTNQNHREHIISVRMAKIKKQVLMWLWKIRTLHTLLVEM